jgi:RES domain-containing protein
VIDVAAVATLPRRRITGRFWHHGSPRRALESFADPARSSGRYHVSGGAGVWYASNQEQAAWAELFRHFLDDGVDPFEVRRRIGAATVTDLEVLDLTSAATRTALGITEEDLTGDDYAATQAIATTARQTGCAGLLAPSAALPGRQTLVVFADGMPCVATEPSRVRQPPPRLADLLAVIRPHPDVSAGVRRTLHALYLAGSGAVRRLRRRR